MFKKFLFLFATILIWGSSLTPVFAQDSNSKSDNEIPEKDGIYNVHGRPDLKVRVFIHKPRPAKPRSGGKPTPTPTPTCNLEDPDSVSTVPAAGWHLPSGTWTYYLNPQSAPASVGSNLSVIANNAFGVWTQATIGKVTFANGGTTTATQQGLDGKNIIAWGRKISSAALAITYTWYNPITGQVTEEDTIFNKSYSWSWTPYTTTGCTSPNSYDAQNVLTHELGHWMGLNDTYDAENYQNATMYGYGSTGEIKKDTLTTGDITGTTAIYQ